MTSAIVSPSNGLPETSRPWGDDSLIASPPEKLSMSMEDSLAPEPLQWLVNRVNRREGHAIDMPVSFPSGPGPLGTGITIASAELLDTSFSEDSIDEGLSKPAKALVGNAGKSRPVLSTDLMTFSPEVRDSGGKGQKLSRRSPHKEQSNSTAPLHNNSVPAETRVNHVKRIVSNPAPISDLAPLSSSWFLQTVRPQQKEETKAAAYAANINAASSIEDESAASGTSTPIRAWPHSTTTSAHKAALMTRSKMPFSVNVPSIDNVPALRPLYKTQQDDHRGANENTINVGLSLQHKNLRKPVPNDDSARMVNDFVSRIPVPSPKKQDYSSGYLRKSVPASIENSVSRAFIPFRTEGVSSGSFKPVVPPELSEQPQTDVKAVVSSSHFVGQKPCDNNSLHTIRLPEPACPDATDSPPESNHGLSPISICMDQVHKILTMPRRLPQTDQKIEITRMEVRPSVTRSASQGANDCAIEATSAAKQERSLFDLRSQSVPCGRQLRRRSASWSSRDQDDELDELRSRLQVSIGGKRELDTMSLESQTSSPDEHDRDALADQRQGSEKGNTCIQLQSREQMTLLSAKSVHKTSKGAPDSRCISQNPIANHNEHIVQKEDNSRRSESKAQKLHQGKNDEDHAPKTVKQIDMLHQRVIMLEKLSAESTKNERILIAKLDEELADSSMLKIAVKEWMQKYVDINSELEAKTHALNEETTKYNALEAKEKEISSRLDECMRSNRTMQLQLDLVSAQYEELKSLQAVASAENMRSTKALEERLNEVTNERNQLQATVSAHSRDLKALQEEHNKTITALTESVKSHQTELASLKERAHLEDANYKEQITSLESDQCEKNRMIDVLTTAMDEAFRMAQGLQGEISKIRESVMSRNVKTSTRLFQCIRRAALSRIFDMWSVQAREAWRTEAFVSKLQRLKLKGRIEHLCRSWRHFSSQQRVRSHTFDRAVTCLTLRKLSAVWKKWSSDAAEQRRLQASCAMIVQRMRDRQLVGKGLEERLAGGATAYAGDTPVSAKLSPSALDLENDIARAYSLGETEMRLHSGDRHGMSPGERPGAVSWTHSAASVDPGSGLQGGSRPRPTVLHEIYSQGTFAGTALMTKPGGLAGDRPLSLGEQIRPFSSFGLPGGGAAHVSWDSHVRSAGDSILMGPSALAAASSLSGGQYAHSGVGAGVALPSASGSAESLLLLRTRDPIDVLTARLAVGLPGDSHSTFSASTPAFKFQLAVPSAPAAGHLTPTSAHKPAGLSTAGVESSRSGAHGGPSEAGTGRPSQLRPGTWANGHPGGAGPSPATAAGRLKAHQLLSSSPSSSRVPPARTWVSTSHRSKQL